MSKCYTQQSGQDFIVGIISFNHKNVDNKVYNTNTTEYAVNYINSLFRIDFKNHLKAFEFIMSTNKSALYKLYTVYILYE